jgi:Tfp pilus assembly protein PilN
VRAVNLIPAEQRAGGGPVAGESQGAAFLVLGLLAGLAVLAGLYGLAAHQVSSREGEVTSITAQAQATQARANALAPYTSFKAMYQQRQSAVNELVNTRFDWAHAFHELGRVLPADASLSSVKGTIGSTTAVGGATATPSKTASSAVASATPPGTIPTFVIAGCTTSQSETAQTIQRLRLIDGVASVTLQSSTKTSSGGGSTGSGGCPPNDPAFALTVTFAALPSPPAASPALPSASAASTASGGSRGSPVSNSTTTKRPQ